MEIGRSLKVSRREMQIIVGLFDGQTEQAIAISHGISARTVHTYVERLHRKLVVRDRVQLVVLVVGEFLSLTASPNHCLPPLCANRASGRCPCGF